MAYLPAQPSMTLFDAFKADPEIARAVHQLSEAVMRGPSPFTAAQREMIATLGSDLNGCHFCRDSHRAAAVGLGVADAVLDSVLAGQAPPDMPALAPVLAYARKLTLEPARVGQADVDAILAAGWGEDAVRHTALVIGLFSLMNRWVEGLGIETDPRTVAAAGRMLSQRGYAAVAEMVEPDGAR